jgi:glyoxylase I family protein
MKLNRIHHIAIDTVNIEVSVKFYTEIMGFSEIRRVPNGDNTLVYMKVNENSAIELFDHEKDIGYFEHPDYKSGTAHIAFDVCSIEKWNEHLKRHNVEFVLNLCSLEHLGKNVVLFRDPNGVVIELCEDIRN